MPKNVGHLGKLIVAKGFKNFSKVQQIAQSGHIGYIHVVQDDLEGYANTVTTSTTRFGENLKDLCNLLRAFFCFGHNFDPHLAKNYAIWQSFIAVNGQN